MSNVIKLFTTTVVLIIIAARPVMAENIKITPLGSNKGEFCQLDRAMVLEDPDGTRILYDPGRTVAGPDDARLGKIDAILVSHMHGDHVGDKHIESVGSGDCKTAKFPVKALPNTNLVNIALAKNAKIVTGSEMPKFFASKLKALGGNPKNSQLVRFGASLKVGGVTITTVPAVHSNGIAGSMIGGDLGDMLDAAGLTAYAGPPTGYVLTFSNGLAVYLSGDTGVTAEQDTVVRQLYNAKLVVMNIGDTYTTGPKEAAWVVNKLIKPKSVIPSHANQPSTSGGNVIEGTRVDTFMKATKAKVYVPLSGKTMSFDKKGKCVAGC
jgi:L-ascorbate metabolism protein UlaG (beta-lactamase superfamily)